MSTSHAMSGFTKVLIGLVGLFIVIALVIIAARLVWRWVTDDRVVEVEQSEVLERASVEKTIHIHETAEAFGVRVTPYDFQDDRCPPNAECIEGGGVLALVYISEGVGDSTERFILRDTITRDTVAVTFADVTPLPVPGTVNELTDYEFTFVFESYESTE